MNIDVERLQEIRKMLVSNIEMRNGLPVADKSIIIVLALIENEIARQSVTDEEIKDAIKAIKGNWPPSNYTMLRKALTLAITALQQMKPEQAVTDEAVRDAIAWANHEHSRCMVNLLFGDADCASLAITALQQMGEKHEP